MTYRALVHFSFVSSKAGPVVGGVLGAFVALILILILVVVLRGSGVPYKG